MDDRPDIATCATGQAEPQRLVWPPHASSRQRRLRAVIDALFAAGLVVVVLGILCRLLLPEMGWDPAQERSAGRLGGIVIWSIGGAVGIVAGLAMWRRTPAPREK